MNAIAAELRTARETNAEPLARAVAEELASLGMERASSSSSYGSAKSGRPEPMT
jgi:DNA repair ATPase RecN